MELTDLLTDLPILDESKFRFQNQKCMLTYKTHIDKFEFQEFMEKKCPVKTIYIAHENGVNDPNTPYEHSHVVIDFGKSFQSKNQRVFDFKNIHPHISIIKNDLSWKKSCKYITKEDSSVILKEDDICSQIEKIWSHKNVTEALKCSTLKDAQATIAVFQHKPRRMPKARVPPEIYYPWQKSLVEIFHTEPDGRTLMWLYDPVGKQGKTQFGKSLCILEGEKYTIMNNIGQVKDFIMNLKSIMDAGWDGDTIILNLVRDYQDKDHIYTALETVIDGFATATKYMGGTFFFPDLHVIVMANFEPNFTKVTLDRWRLFQISDDQKLIKLANMRN